MKKLILLLSISLAIILTNCSPKLLLKNSIKLDTLGICINYKMQINPNYETQKYFDSTLSVFITNYNKETHPIKVSLCQTPTTNSLNIDILNTNLITPGKQASAVAISAIGLALPFIMVAAELPFWIAFVYLPSNVSETNVYLSWDINGRKIRLIKEIKSNPYFGSLESQKKDHAEAFFNFLNDQLEEIESSYKDNNKK